MRVERVLPAAQTGPGVYNGNAHTCFPSAGNSGESDAQPATSCAQASPTAWLLSKRDVINHIGTQVPGKGCSRQPCGWWAVSTAGTCVGKGVRHRDTATDAPAVSTGLHLLHHHTRAHSIIVSYGGGYAAQGTRAWTQAETVDNSKTAQPDLPFRFCNAAHSLAVSGVQIHSFHGNDSCDCVWYARIIINRLHGVGCHAPKSRGHARSYSPLPISHNFATAAASLLSSVPPVRVIAAAPRNRCTIGTTGLRVVAPMAAATSDASSGGG